MFLLCWQVCQVIKVRSQWSLNSIEHFSCENTDELILNSPVICLFLNSCTLFFIHFCFPRRVLTRNRGRDKQPRQAADCCAERSPEKLSDSWIKISIKWVCSAAYYPHHWAYVLLFVHVWPQRIYVPHQKTLKSNVWVCFVNILLYWVLNFNLCYDDPIQCTAILLREYMCVCLFSVPI